MFDIEVQKKRVKIVFSLFVMWLAIFGWDKLQTKIPIPNYIYYINLILIATLLLLWNFKK